jgi:hypothetical protein
MKKLRTLYQITAAVNLLTAVICIVLPPYRWLDAWTAVCFAVTGTAFLLMSRTAP